VWCREEGNCVVYKEERQLLCGKMRKKTVLCGRKKEPCRVIRRKGKLCVAMRKEFCCMKRKGSVF